MLQEPELELELELELEREREQELELELELEELKVNPTQCESHPPNSSPSQSAHSKRWWRSTRRLPSASARAVSAPQRISGLRE